MVSSVSRSEKKTKSEISEPSDAGNRSERFEKRQTYSASNAIEYKLSDPHFLDIGWTIKPTKRIISKIVQYETQMAKPYMNRFHLKRHSGIEYYDNSEIPFTEFNSNGSGRVFYPNGNLAISIEKLRNRSYTRYKVLTPGGEDARGCNLEAQMLAVFDSLGNGIVLSENNGTRLTYNQIGGISFENKMPYLWTWSQRRVESTIESIDTDDHSDRLEKLMQLFVVKSTKSSSGVKSPKSDRGFERRGTLTNFVFEEFDEHLSGANHFKQSKSDVLRPVKIICLRLNRFLSLRIVDRHNISLKFLFRRKNIRIELGTVLNLKKPISFYTTNISEGFGGLLRSRFDYENLDKSLEPESSLYSIYQEHLKVKKNQEKRSECNEQYLHRIQMEESQEKRKKIP